MLQRLNEGGDPVWRQPQPRRRWPRPLASRLANALRRILRTIGVWRDRSKKRRQLARFTPTEMRDLAISRLDVLHEINKPFWRP